MLLYHQEMTEQQIHTGQLLGENNDRQAGCIAAYVGLAVGDALGATVEFMTESEIRHDYGVHNQITGGGWLHLKPGSVTDDTTMSFALGANIINTQRINPYDISHAFSDWLKSKPVDVGNTVRRGIQNFRITNDPFVHESEYSAGNGACMRSLPIAIATLDKAPDIITQANRFHCHTTHNNILSDDGTRCVIDMVQMALNGKDMEQIHAGPVNKLLKKHAEFSFQGKKISNPSGFIVDTLKTVFDGLFTTSNFEDCLVKVVNRGGDADTTGAIAGMIAGAYYGLEAIPGYWSDRLEAGVVDTCTQQAIKLYQLRDNIHISDSTPLL